MSVRISAVVMHHPARTAGLARLVEACGAVRPRLVPDPAPDAPPSPLRTAKRAWAAIEDTATHHLVLQDDIAVKRGFAEDLRNAVLARPTQPLALYVNWNSPYNSYAVRRAAAIGHPWAPLSPREWVPTLGLAVPVERARILADRLASMPDELRHDDDAVSACFREQGLTVLAAVPHLVEHRRSRSIAGNDTHGARHATVYAEDMNLSAEHWRGDRDVDAALSGSTFAVELHNSTCRLRFLRPHEPVAHPFGWYWREWCELIGVDATQVLADAPRCAPVAAEVWAACYLLGVDTAHLRRGVLPESIRAVLLRRAVTSWIDSGVLRADLAEISTADLVEVGLDAVGAGQSTVRAEAVAARA